MHITLWIIVLAVIWADMMCFFSVADQHKKAWQGLVIGSGFYLLWKHGAK